MQCMLNILCTKLYMDGGGEGGIEGSTQPSISLFLSVCL